MRLSLISLLLAGLSLTSPELSAGATSRNDRFIIVAPKNVCPALQEFVRHKQRLLPTELFPLETVLALSAETNGDDPEKLKRFLYSQWRKTGLSHVLLVGDVDVMPVRFMVLDRVTPTAHDYAFYPSDLYYADLAKGNGEFDDWNARKDSFHLHYYGEVRGEKNKQDPINYDDIHYLPEVAVGRWPVSTPEEVARVADKTIQHEKRLLASPEKSRGTAAFVAVDGWVDSRQLLAKLSDELAKDWRVEQRFYADKGQEGATPPPDHEQVRGLLNAGCDLIVHTGHGQADAWEKCLFPKDLDQITNTTVRPVFLSAGCSTAYFAPLPPYGAYVDAAGKEHNGTDNKEVFDSPPPPPAPYQRDRFNPTGLGEMILKHPSAGGVAYIGCNTGSQPCGLTLVEGFVQALARSDKPRLGDCWNEAIRHYHKKERLAELKPNADWYPPSIFFQGMKFMVFGDPTLLLPNQANSTLRR